MKQLHIYCLLIIASGILFVACKKDSIITSPSAKLSISVDSLKYDTVFTTVGSITQSFKINNLNDQKLKLDRVKLMDVDTSAFTININGHAVSELSNIEIAAEDSIYVFVTVTVDPTQDDLPFVIQDSIQVQYNGNTRYVQLEAYGQNAHFLRGETIDANTTWNNDLPYVILDSLKVNTAKTLIINRGCKIYMHANAPIIVDGRFFVRGTKDEPVIFTGDRLDEGYRDLPASWPGIYFRETSFGSNFTYAIIKNAYQAIVALLPSNNSQPKVTIQQSIIDNAYDAGIIAINSRIAANNTLISNCGTNVSLLSGGDYEFTNCTVASYGNIFIEHTRPVLVVTNFIDGYATAALFANFTNCIFWGDYGNVKDEVIVSTRPDIDPVVNFIHCIYKAEKNDVDGFFDTESMKNQDPLFDSINIGRQYFDFHTSSKSTAPGIDAGVATTFLLDLEGNSRVVNGITDIGAYEKQ
ncbi:MAG: hypothetical protein V4556_06485 [Bacteroidota bacterium]